MKCIDGMVNKAINRIREGNLKKPNCIWLEASGCFGEVISLLNGEDPDILYFMKEMVNLRFFNTIMADQGEISYKQILDILESDNELILIVCGAIPLKEKCAIVARYEGKEISALQALKTIASKSKYIIAAGTCAAFGGPTAAGPNVSKSVDISKALRNNKVINVPGCPVHPIWILGTLGYIIIWNA